MCNSDDEYESGPIKTVGGPSGNYIIRSPYNTECEWAAVCALTSTPNSQTVAELESDKLSVSSAARATYTNQDLNMGAFVELALDFNVTALTGGASPTVTFKVSRIGNDGILYQLEQATVISAPGVISYHIGMGGDGKPFGNSVQVDMVTTGGPTSITFSSSGKAKGPASSLVGGGQITVSSQDPSVYNMSLNPTVGPITSGGESNAFDGLLIPISYAQVYAPIEFWQPLGRGVNIYVGIIAPSSSNAYIQIAFRRKLDRVIPATPRQKPHTHSHVQSRRGTRTMMAGFAAQYPEESGAYEHEPVPTSQDTAVAKRGVFPLGPKPTQLGPTNVTHRGVGRNHNGR